MADKRPQKIKLFGNSGTDMTEQETNEFLVTLAEAEAEIISIAHAASQRGDNPWTTVMIVYRDKQPKGVGGTARSY